MIFANHGDDDIVCVRTGRTRVAILPAGGCERGPIVMPGKRVSVRAGSAVLLLAAAIAAVMPGPARAAVGAEHARGRPAVVPAPLSMQEAQSQAESIGQPVTATAISSATSTTVANPDGSFTSTESAEPVQAYANGTWQPLNADLQQNGNGTWSPTVSAAPLILSGGEAAPLASMSAEGRYLSLEWPVLLPTPTVSGPTATYANVYPGVDLVVTADGQGGFESVLVVRNATAAANPALASVTLSASTNMVLSTDAAGGLYAAAATGDPSMITFQAPQIWDSTPPTGGTATAQDGTLIDANSGMPANSSVTGPGASANTATVPVTLSGNTITMTPPASVLTAPNVTYPVYIDPAWHNFAASKESSWTQVDSGYPTTSYWNERGHLQVGVCPVEITPPSQSCGTGGSPSDPGVGVARSFVRLQIPAQLHKSTDIHQADLYMTDQWSPSCTKTSVRLYATGQISPKTTWNNQPNWPSTYDFQDLSFGYPGCSPASPWFKNDVTWDVTTTIGADAGNQAYQTWGLRAADEDTSSSAAIQASELEWKLFLSGHSNVTLSVIYNYPPDPPSHLSTDPGGSCHTSKNHPAQIGLDDVTFNSTATDDDGDNKLTSELTIYNASGTAVYDSATTNPSQNFAGGNGANAPFPILRGAMENLNGSSGTTTPYEYYYRTRITDDFGLTSSSLHNCWIEYNPDGPSKPTVSLSATQVPIGGGIAVSVSVPGCGTVKNPCPVSYAYQVGVSAPVTVTADVNHDWTGSIAIPEIGPIQIRIYGIAVGGNPGEASTKKITGMPPSTPCKDGYFTCGTYPDLLTLGTGTEPSLWLSAGNGNGSLKPPVDIGSLGTLIKPGTDGPGDWAGALVLHGDFTGHHVQDAMAYYPSGAEQGTGVILPGDGDPATLDPAGNGAANINATLMTSMATGTTPTDLVAAGNASGLSTGSDDLIGISPDIGPTSTGELDIYTNGQCTACEANGDYAYYGTITTTAPDGTNDWPQYTLTTTENPGSTTLFALNMANGSLWETTGPYTIDQPTSSLTWTNITPTPWGTAAPHLLSGDINQSGQIELWVMGSGRSVTAYTLNGTTLTAEAAGAQSLLSTSINQWALTDGNDSALGSTATTATDEISGDTATLTGNVSWDDDDYFISVIACDGTNGYLAPPANIITSEGDPLSVSVWFKTTKANGVLVSVQGQPLSTGGTTSGGYDPVLYVGEDGLLNAEWWSGGIAPLVSAHAVNDGIWHRVTFSAHEEVHPNGVNLWIQTLVIDGGTPIQSSIAGSPIGNWANLTFGAGYIGGNWPDELHYHENGNAGFAQYFDGQIASVNLGG